MDRFLDLLVIVVLIALPIRLYVANQTVMISRDGVVFIWYAQKLAEHPIAQMKSQAHHPFYPAAVLASHKLLQIIRPVIPVLPDDPVLSWQLAAKTVTMIGGLAVVVAVYCLANLLFDHRVGMI
ncbi:MAG: hypothetical protein JSV03_09195, partial [Planctomycetota bacterium]